MPPLTSYQRQLFVFLSVASFFEGYDFIALTQILPNFRQDMGMGEAAGGVLVAFINFGTVVAYLLIRKADRWGRKRVLTITIAGYTVSTFLSGLAPEPISFAVFQFFGRIFLISEWAVSMVYAAEEFPAKRRGMVIGVIQGFSSLGAIACAGLVPFLLSTAWGWRTVYFVGIAPLVLLAFARRNLRESRRFEQQIKGTDVQGRSLLHIFSTPHRKRLFELALIWGFTYASFHTAVTFWKEFVVAERAFTDGMVGTSITVAALVAMPLVFLVGPMMDAVGRKRSAAVVFLLGAAGVFSCYTLTGQWPLTAALIFGIVAASAAPSVLNAFTTELFPTGYRSDAFAWANNLLGRIGYVVAPAVVGFAASTTGWGWAVRVTVVFPLIALVLILVLLPETMAKELEETAAIPSPQT